MPRPRARAPKGLRPPPQEAPAPDVHEVGHLAGEVRPGVWVSTFTYHRDGVFHAISSGEVSRRAFNTHFLRHRAWMGAYWEHGKVPPEALTWTG